MTPPTTPPTTSVFVQTRGRPRHRDYDFLGAGPEQSWWRAYAGHTAFERPTVLVESDGDGHRVYLSGVPSARRDSVGTVIRYTLVLEQPGGTAPALDPSRVVALVACWLEDQAGGTDGALSRALDGAFPEDDVERMLADAGPTVPAQVQQRVVAAVRALPDPGPAVDDAHAAGADWFGDAGAPRAVAAFADRVAELVVGRRAGRALLLNLVGSAADLTPLLDDARPLAVLAPDIAVAGPTRLDRERGPVGVGKATASAAVTAPRTTGPAPSSPNRSPSRVRTVLTPVVLGLAAVIAVLVPLLSR